MQTIDVLEAHIIDRGFNPLYTKWIFHGEVEPEAQVETNNTCEDVDEMYQVLNDIVQHSEDIEGRDPTLEEEYQGGQFDDLFAELDAELWPGCTTFSSLNFLVKLMHIKVMNKWTNKSFDDLLKLLKKSHPVDNKIPNSHYEAKMKLHKLGLGYESIHVCQYDCALFWKENACRDTCPICEESRWVLKGCERTKIPHKVLRYFPLKDRLKRLYGSRHTAQYMRWHEKGRSKEEGVLRHPVDGEAWKQLDQKYPDFSSEPRNVRLGLVADGFNPFGNMSLSYS